MEEKVNKLKKPITARAEFTVSTAFPRQGKMLEITTSVGAITDNVFTTVYMCKTTSNTVLILSFSLSVLVTHKQQQS